MQKADFIALINPAITLAVALALFILWNYRRDRRYVATLGVAYITLSAGFLLEYLLFGLGRPSVRLVTNLMLVAGVCLLFSGVMARYRLASALKPVLAICGVAVAGFVWFLYVDPNQAMRILAMNYLGGAMLLLLAWRVRGAQSGNLIDSAIVGLVTIWGAEFFLRTTVVVWLEAPYGQGVDFFATLYWITLTFSLASFQLLFSVMLIAAIAMDLIEDLKAESATDSLSGLLNRRGFEDRMEAAADEARRKGLPLSLVLCDLDTFKSINDRYGHVTGDRAIALFADCLRLQTAPHQAAARIGGEEFAVILPATDRQGGRLFAESVRNAIAACAVEGMADSDRVTASFGVAEYFAAEDSSALLRRADAALYLAKNSGRDCVRMAETPRADPAVEIRTMKPAFPNWTKTG